MLGIENVLLEHEKTHRDEPLSRKYAELKDRLLSHEYANTMASLPYGNDHGPNHIKRVLEYLDQLVGEEPLQWLNAYELFITMVAALYHDVGMLRCRNEHAAESAKIGTGHFA